jgi:hypothetical protein
VETINYASSEISINMLDMEGVMENTSKCDIRNAEKSLKTYF